MFIDDKCLMKQIVY